MVDNEHRQIARDSLFLMAELRVDGIEGDHRVRVRNLSAGGLMAEGTVRPERGQGVWVNLRNLGWVEGQVAWVQDNRFGVAFQTEIDPRIARTPSPADPQSEMVVPRPGYHDAALADAGQSKGRVRKI